MQLGAMHNIYYSYFGQSTRMVDSGIFIDKICWFYPNRESTFWTIPAILKLQVPILAKRNNKMGHRINKMWTLINKVGHRNVKLVVTYQQKGFKKQQNGSRVLYLLINTSLDLQSLWRLALPHLQPSCCCLWPGWSLSVFFSQICFIDQVGFRWFFFDLVGFQWFLFDQVGFQCTMGWALLKSVNRGIYQKDSLRPPFS